MELTHSFMCPRDYCLLAGAGAQRNDGAHIRLRGRGARAYSTVNFDGVAHQALSGASLVKREASATGWSVARIRKVLIRNLNC